MRRSWAASHSWSQWWPSFRWHFGRGFSHIPSPKQKEIKIDSWKELSYNQGTYSVASETRTKMGCDEVDEETRLASRAALTPAERYRVARMELRDGVDPIGDWLGVDPRIWEPMLQDACTARWTRVRMGKRPPGSGARTILHDRILSPDIVTVLLPSGVAIGRTFLMLLGANCLCQSQTPNAVRRHHWPESEWMEEKGMKLWVQVAKEARDIHSRAAVDSCWGATEGVGSRVGCSPTVH